MHPTDFEHPPRPRQPNPALAVRPRYSLIFTLGLLVALLCTKRVAYAQDKRHDDAASPKSEVPPENDKSSEAGTPVSAEGSDIDALRQEYLRLRDELFRSRARAAAVASAMYSTRISLFLNYGSSRFHTVTRATIRLDGANVYDDPSGAIANDMAARFEGFIAPGRHVISIRIETTSKDDERFILASEHTFTIQAPAGSDVIITAKAKDESDIAYAWQKKERGSYRPSMSVSVKTEKRAATANETTPKTSAPTPAELHERRASSGGARGQ